MLNFIRKLQNQLNYMNADVGCMEGKGRFLLNTFFSLCNENILHHFFRSNKEIQRISAFAEIKKK